MKNAIFLSLTLLLVTGCDTSTDGPSADESSNRLELANIEVTASGTLSNDSFITVEVHNKSRWKVGFNASCSARIHDRSGAQTITRKHIPCNSYLIPVDPGMRAFDTIDLRYYDFESLDGEYVVTQRILDRNHGVAIEHFKESAPFRFDGVDRP